MDIDITGLKKTDVLIALYAAAKPQGMGYLQFQPGYLDAKEAAELMEAQRGRFDYVKGRVLKVNLAGDFVSSSLYDRDNGQGAFARAIAHLRVE